jgi:hypothetical protein
MVRERVSPVQTQATIEVKGEIKLSAAETAAVMQRIEELAAKFSIGLPEPKTIEGRVIEHD